MTVGFVMVELFVGFVVHVISAGVFCQFLASCCVLLFALIFLNPAACNIFFVNIWCLNTVKVDGINVGVVSYPIVDLLTSSMQIS